MNNKRKLQHIPIGITKNEASYQVAMIELMNKLLEETRENSRVLREAFNISEKRDVSTPSMVNYKSSGHGVRKAMTGMQFYPRAAESSINYRSNNDFNGLEGRRLKEVQEIKEEESKILKPQQDEEKAVESNVDMNKFMQQFHNSLLQMTRANQKIYEKLDIIEKVGNNSLINEPSSLQKEEQDKQIFNKAIFEILNQRYKKSYEHYGIISQVLPFSDKRQMKIRYRIIDIIDKQKQNQTIPFEQLKKKTTEWTGMVFRATASICWNMLLSNHLNFQEIKILFTENIIFNFIQYMKDIGTFIAQDKRLQLTNYINYISCEILQFLCRQYPQTKVQAPNIALRKSIPIIQNQGQSKFDLITMASRDLEEQGIDQQLDFKAREDKDYCSLVMKVINYMIDQTQSQYSRFQKFMTNIFEKIYIPKEKRSKMKGYQPTISDASDSQYRQKVKGYSSYLIGRKIPKNIIRYSSKQIQFGVFFVKSPSILRIITKWFEELWQFISTPLQSMKSSTNEIKDHSGKVINISTRVKHIIFQQVCEKIGVIQTKIQKIRLQCYKLQLQLTDQIYTFDEKQIHLSQDQISVGKYCSNLRNAISSYVCTQLSKVIHYLLKIPNEINETLLEFDNEDFQDQAQKHLDCTNLITLKIFDLLRCKCHSNEQEIIYIVQALKQFEREDPKFQIVRVKDRLNQGTRDIMINAQYDGGLVWQIQLAVTSHSDKKQDLLDKYNHFLYQLKRTKLGPISQCVSIYSSLQQRLIYFEQLIRKKKLKGSKCQITHKGKNCKLTDYSSILEFKRPIICLGCQQYFAIPSTSLLNVRCDICFVTYCGLCFFNSLDQMEKKKFMFQNFRKKKIMNNSAFTLLQQYTDYKKPIPKQGFFIDKNFLNRQLSFYTISKVDQDHENPSIFQIRVCKSFIKNGKIQIKALNEDRMMITEINSQYYLNGSQKQFKNSQFQNVWIYYFPNRQTDEITLQQLQNEMKDPSKGRMKYLNILFQQNYMSEMKLCSKFFEKMRLINRLKQIEDIENYKISVYRFPNFTVLAKLDLQEKKLEQMLVKSGNLLKLQSFAKKKITIINMQQSDLSDQLASFLLEPSQTLTTYIKKVQKIYLADNDIKEMKFISNFKNLQALSISKNCLTSLQGVQDLVNLHYIKFDDNQISSLKQLKNLKKLTYISGNNNHIGDLTGLEDLINLGSLSLCNNKISQTTILAKLLALKRVYLRDNPIKSITPINDIQIKILYLGNTHINVMEISKASFITNLKQLSLKSMKLQSIPSIFQEASMLQQLKLAKNSIRKIENLQACIKLIRLDLSDNLISTMQNLEQLQNLQHLNLKNNKIEVIDGVKSFIQSLKTLQMQMNPLDDLSGYLLFEENAVSSMRLKFTEESISAKAKQQLKNHVFQLGNRSQSDD